MKANTKNKTFWLIVKGMRKEERMETRNIKKDSVKQLQIKIFEERRNFYRGMFRDWDKVEVLEKVQ